MKKTILVVATALMIGAASAAWMTEASPKLPKCSGKLCHPDCPAEVLCASGAHVKSCAQWCGGI